MSRVLMPKATAIWLIDNTALTFAQIAAFTGLHDLDIQSLADGEGSIGAQGLDPVRNGQLTAAEIARCEGDPTARLVQSKSVLPQPVTRSKGPRYTPMSKRADKPNAIAWLVKTHPDLNDAQICRLIGTTRTTIAAIRARSHWNYTNLQPRSPVDLGLCPQTDLDHEVAQAQARVKQDPESEAVPMEPAAGPASA